MRKGADWNGTNVDFPIIDNVVLAAGQEYAYDQSRDFTTTGQHFAEPVVKIGGMWLNPPDANRVTFAVGTSTLALSGVTPNTGVPSGGTVVTLTGAGFVSGATVKFGTVAATNVTFVNAQTLRATTPMATQGTVDVVVTNPDGQSAMFRGFTFVAPGGVAPVPTSRPTVAITAAVPTPPNPVPPRRAELPTPGAQGGATPAAAGTRTPTPNPQPMQR